MLRSKSDEMLVVSTDIYGERAGAIGTACGLTINHSKISITEENGYDVMNIIMLFPCEIDLVIVLFLC